MGEINNNNIEIDVEVEQPTGTKDHKKLINRDLADQHPIKAITGLEDAIDGKVDNVEGKSLIDDTLITKLEGIEEGAEVNDVTTVAGRVGDVVLTKSDVGLANVDNTSDLNKPISTATQTALNGKQDTINDLADIRTGAGKGATAAQPADIKDATLTIQKNSTTVGTFSANASTNKTIDLNIPVNASDVNALPNSTKYAANMSLSVNSETFVITAQLKDQNGNNLGNAQTIDLPLESVVVNGSYDSVNKKVVLTLQNGSEIKFSVADLISGLQSEINANNKLSADFVDDSSTTHKFVSSSEKETWNGKQNAINSSNKLSADNVDDTSTTHKFVSSTEKATWNAKQNAISGAVTSVLNDNLSANKVVTSDANGKITVSTVKASELATLTGISSNIQEQLDGKQNINDEVYDLFIDFTNSNPANCVTYGGVNASYTPAAMNFTSGQFEYGSWSNAFFLKIFNPCMLKFDGTVDYYLDPNDYTKKSDGITPSDISDTSYGGNGMVEIGQIWLSEEEYDGKTHVRIANRKIDSTFECITHRKKDGTYLDKVYRSLFDGSLVSSKIRSIKGQSVCKNQTGNNQITYAKANGSGHDVDTVALRRTINYILILLGKSLNTQAVFGQGVTSGGEAGQVVAGTLSDKGMFWGSSGTTSAVKVLHMENLWGNNWKIHQGLICVNGKLKYKMCEGTYDGSTTENYNTNGSGYIDSGVTVGGTPGGFISEVALVRGLGIVPKTMSGSDSTYLCDGMWFNASLADGFARFGGHSDNGSMCGAFYCAVTYAVGNSNWLYGVALSYKKAS